MATINVQGTMVNLPAEGDGLKVIKVRDTYKSKANRYGISAYAIDAQGKVYSISASQLSDAEVAKLTGKPAPVAPIVVAPVTPTLSIPAQQSGAAFLNF